MNRTASREGKAGLSSSRWTRMAMQALAIVIAAAGAAAHDRVDQTRWHIEQGVDAPSYAVIEPMAADVNIDTVVLGCEQTGRGTVLQLQLYLSDAGRLAPIGVPASDLTDEPRAGISIDGDDYSMTVMFAEDHVVLADELDGALPGLSARLIDAMRAGETMVLRFRLLASRRDSYAGFDSGATVDLEAAGAGQALDALRHCVGGGLTIGSSRTFERLQKSGSPIVDPV